MCIIAKQQICVHIDRITCLSSYPMGRYALRFFLSYKHNHSKKYAIPISIIDDPCRQNPGSEIQENAYKTKEFLMKPNTMVLLNESCVFKNQLNILEYQPDYTLLPVSVACQLVRVDSSQDQVLDRFDGVLHGANAHDVLLIDFAEPAACQVLGTIHACIYQYEYQPTSEKIPTLHEYCQIQNSQYIRDLLNYLKMEEKVNLNHIQKAFEKYDCKKEQMKSVDMDVPEQNILDQQKERDLFKSIKEKSRYLSSESETFKPEKDVETKAHENEFNNTEDSKRKRKKIFGDRRQKIKRIEKEKVQEKQIIEIDDFEKDSHKNSVKIYSKWREFVGILNAPSFHSAMNALHNEYMEKMKKLMGESVVRFKGSWDIDLYANQIAQRNKIALQARTFFGQTSKDRNEFHFYNKNFFNEKRPIFFQELVNVDEDREIKQVKQAFVVLVHGLGACRTDMERMKVQLKRYLGKKVHILVSMSNEGRTEGDIDAMGVRLAMEMDHEIAKFKRVPPITFIGHSLGGIIIRSALPRLSKHSDHFNSFISFSTPHVGYTYSSSRLIDVGLWLMNYWKKCQAILQMTMQDQSDPTETFLYKLAKSEGLEHFRKVAFFCSHQDLYVPYYSARIQKHQDCVKDCKSNILKGKVHNEMIDNILNSIKGDIIRTDVNFCISQQNLDNLIGRAAHISFLQSTQMLRILCLTGQKIIL